MSNLVGKVLHNRFRVDAFIGSGGMGVVYRVWDTERNVALAMKVLHADLSEDPVAFKRIQREAHALEELAHPHITPFYGMFQAEGYTFLIEQFIDGPSLEVLMRQRSNEALPPHEALIYLKALCSALGYAHNRGFVHCDVKPGNVMIDKVGNIFLADFGVARQAASSTTTLGVVGTPAYMAPEQIMSQPVSAATDIYALGVLLYKLLTGRRPFTVADPSGESSSKTPPEGAVYAHLVLPPPNPQEINPSIPDALAQVVMTCMAKEAGARYQTTMELLDAACAAIGISPKQVPTRVRITEKDTGTVRLPTPAGEMEGLASQTPGIMGTIKASQPPIAAGTVKAGPSSPMGTLVTPVPPQGGVGTMRVSQPAMQTEAYQAEAYPAAQPAAGGLPTWLWGIIGAAVVILVCGGIGFALILPRLDGLGDKEAPLPTFTSTSTLELPGGQAKPATNTPTPTFTLPPVFTPFPTFTSPPPTEPPPPPTPTPTFPPVLSNVLVRIRNRTGGDVNLYRFGTTGERHFLGWLVHGYYGEYRFPSLGFWTIQYCRRDPSGSDISCKEKQIEVTAEGQEFVVP